MIWQSAMVSAVDLPIQISKVNSPRETPIVTMELPDNEYPTTILCKANPQEIRPQRYSTLKKAHLRLPTTSWLRPSRCDIHSYPYVGQLVKSTKSCHVRHDLRSTTFADHKQLFLSSRVITYASSSKRTTHHALHLKLFMQVFKTQTTYGMDIPGK